tara:strand:+ start:224 stop:373 length:150 start_codon:yes stop_codon:yes gene_type:complete
MDRDERYQLKKDNSANEIQKRFVEMMKKMLLDSQNNKLKQMMIDGGVIN